MKRLTSSLLLSFALPLAMGCGGLPVFPPGSTQPLIATPVIATTPALSGAVIITLTTSTPASAIYYTLDGTTPNSATPQYFAPFLLASNATLNAITISPSGTSTIATQTFSPNIPSGTLIWSDEFSNTTTANAQPNPATWTYDTGNSGFGNQELENYCAWNSSTSPCDPSDPNAYVGTEGYLHIVALQPSAGVYTSARLKSQGLFSLQYGRLEARIHLPEGQGLWPAFWLVGNNITTLGWPACGEQDIMEHVDQPSPDWVLGSVHMPNDGLSLPYPASYASGFDASQWHTYGMIWSPGSVQYYVDSPTNIYATYTTSTISAQPTAIWPFDSSGANFIFLNLAVGGSWPGSPDSTTPFPAEMLVDYVRLYRQ